MKTPNAHEFNKAWVRLVLARWRFEQSRIETDRILRAMVLA